MALLIIVLTSDLVWIRLNILHPTGIAHCINFRGQGTRIGVIFIVFFLPPVFFLFFPSLVGGLGIPCWVKAQRVVKI